MHAATVNPLSIRTRSTFSAWSLMGRSVPLAELGLAREAAELAPDVVRDAGAAIPLPGEFARAAVDPSHEQKGWSRARACLSPGGESRSPRPPACKRVPVIPCRAADGLAGGWTSHRSPQ